MRRNVVGILAASLLLLLAACNQYGEALAPSTSAFLRLVHVSPDAPQLQVELNGEVIRGPSNFRDITEYTEIAAGTLNTFVVRDQQGTLLAQAAIRPEIRAEYSIIAFGPVTHIQAGALRDDNRAADPGSVRVRLVHVAEAMGNVDIYFTTPDADLSAAGPNFQDVDDGSVMVYLDRPAGDYRIRATPRLSQTIVLDSGPIAFDARGSYTVFLVENEGGGEPFSVLVSKDAG